MGKENINFPTNGGKKNSLHNFTDNEFQLIQFAVLQNMIIGPTFYPHKDIHTSTWTSPDGVTFNPTNHLLIDRRHKSNLMDVRSFPDNNNESDHCLVIAYLRARISDVKKVIGIRTSTYNVSKLTSSEVAAQYRQQIQEKRNTIALTEEDNGEKL